jgi:threonine/homoserine/homoserine lactone efflux protein
MSIFEIIALFGTMVVLAAMPSTSVALVVTRSITLGVTNGIAVGLGIVLGDLIFIALVLLGLTFVAEAIGSVFVLIKYIGAIYLIWFGVSLLRSRGGEPMALDPSRQRGSLIASFLAGLFLTLGDIKAIFFYLSLLPIFIDLTALRPLDIMVVILVTIFSVGGTKVLYAFYAIRLVSLVKSTRFESASRKVAGAALLGAGSYLVVKA